MEEAILIGEKIIVMPSNKEEAPVIIDNPVFQISHEDKRDSDEFFEQTKRIRKVMQEKW